MNLGLHLGSSISKTVNMLLSVEVNMAIFDIKNRPLLTALLNWSKEYLSLIFSASKHSVRGQLVSQALLVQKVPQVSFTSNIWLKHLSGKKSFTSLSSCLALADLCPCSFDSPPGCSPSSKSHKPHPDRVVQIPHCLLFWEPLSKTFLCRWCSPRCWSWCWCCLLLQFS